MRIAVLFDGAGLARLGLERAGHRCTGFELDPVQHRLACMVGSGDCVLADARAVNLDGFDAVWASPPCQAHSQARRHTSPGPFADGDLLAWSLTLPHPILWVENVPLGRGKHWFGQAYNAAQFSSPPRQSRVRCVAGRHNPPNVLRPFAWTVPGVCPPVLASEWKACLHGCKRVIYGLGRGCCYSRAARFYGRRLTVDECAFHQGFRIPPGWRQRPAGYSRSAWDRVLYEAIGNGVPVFMSRAFGWAHAP